MRVSLTAQNSTAVGTRGGAHVRRNSVAWIYLLLRGHSRSSLGVRIRSVNIRKKKLFKVVRQWVIGSSVVVKGMLAYGHKSKYG